MANSSTSELTAFELELPYELGRYRLEAEIGRGGMGAVYHAEDSLLERPVAVKVLLPALAADPQFVERFKREAQMAARIEHPNIVTVHDVGQHNNLVYFVMRLVTGKPLDRVIEEGLSWARAESIAIQVADAMAYAHEHGVIHRDIKPENVIIGRDGAVTITDFGLARPQQSAHGPTQVGTVLGTPGYMAPEQALGTDIDHRADIYSFGVMLYELVAGEIPFDGETAFAIINQHINTPPPPIHERNEDTPDWLAELIGRTLEKEPDRRPQSMREVAELLRNHQGSQLQRPEAQSATEVSTRSLVEQVRAGDVSLADAMQQHPGESTVLQEAFRQELTVVSFDLAGSTALKQSSGGTVAIGPLFNAYRTLVDQALTQHNVIDSTWAGDGTLALFSRPSEAVGAAQDIVRGLRKVNATHPDVPDLGVRVGVHTGSVLRDPNQPLGQVTSTTLDIVGHLQKDAKEGLVEVSQTTLDKLANQEGWLYLRRAREGELAVYAWHPDGPEHVPQSWIQRLRFGKGETGKGKDEAKAATTTAPSAPAGERQTKPTPKVSRTTASDTLKLVCPYCEAEVTPKDQKCPDCGRLNRYYDPAQDKSRKEKSKAAKISKVSAARMQRPSPKPAEKAPAAAGRPATTGRAAATDPRSGQKKQADADATIQAVTELITGALVSGGVWALIGWFMATQSFTRPLWWTANGTTNLGMLAVSAVPVLLLALATRGAQPVMGAGMLFGLPVGAALLRALAYWV